MRLIVHELLTSLYQEITPTKDAFVEAIRPHILKYGNPAGTLKMQIRDTNNKVCFDGTPINISDISVADYFHGYVRMYINAALKKGTTYRFVLVPGGGYTFSEANYIGWCNDYDLRKYQPSYSPSTGFRAALDMEIWGK